VPPSERLDAQFLRLLFDELQVLHHHQRQIGQAVLADQRDGRDFVGEGRARERRHGGKPEAELTSAHCIPPMCFARA
jgi:hypothetical protein